jgi:hypothetical protein
VNAALIGILVLAIVYVTVDGVVKVRAMHQRAAKPVSPQRMARLSVVRDPLLELPELQSTVVVLMDADLLFRRDP